MGVGLARLSRGRFSSGSLPSAGTTRSARTYWPLAAQARLLSGAGMVTAQGHRCHHSLRPPIHRRVRHLPSRPSLHPLLLPTAALPMSTSTRTPMATHRTSREEATTRVTPPCRSICMSHISGRLTFILRTSTTRTGCTRTTHMATTHTRTTLTRIHRPRRLGAVAVAAAVVAAVLAAGKACHEACRWWSERATGRCEVTRGCWVLVTCVRRKATLCFISCWSDC